ncbi:hypothetical protein D9757_014376 [Collybiopsis confluens]|uniref:Uncharacterized protein n=1 Tax=Collybiopsis confluens TaxID=2823264 RepID=A0A8H5LIU5_9AGAR|nr:hypothetical protein D9757_014376 [Collybiopsis confluens]
MSMSLSNKIRRINNESVVGSNGWKLVEYSVRAIEKIVPVSVIQISCRPYAVKTCCLFVLEATESQSYSPRRLDMYELFWLEERLIHAPGSGHDPIPHLLNHPQNHAEYLFDPSSPSDQREKLIVFGVYSTKLQLDGGSTPTPHNGRRCSPQFLCIFFDNILAIVIRPQCLRSAGF